MKKERLKRIRFPLSDGTLLTVHYWLLTQQRGEKKWFGIALTDSRGASVSLPAISLSRWETTRLLYRMAKGYVTTVTARDVVADYLWERRARE